MALVEVKVPDIGDFSDVAVIELLVAPGDTVKLEQSLITVESDKASMEIPSSAAGVVRELKVKIGDKVSQGSLVLLLESADSASKPAPAQAQQAPAAIDTIANAAPPAAASVASGPVEVRVPDIGDFKDVAVIEVFVQPGDTIRVEQSLITVESDKASMEIPSSAAGVVREMKVKVGDKVNQGDLLALLEGAAPVAAAPAAAAIQPRSTSTARPSSRRSGVTTWNPARPSWIRLSIMTCAAPRHVPSATTRRYRHASQSAAAGNATGACVAAASSAARSASFASIRPRCQLPADTQSAIVASAATATIARRTRSRVSRPAMVLDWPPGTRPRGRMKIVVIAGLCAVVVALFTALYFLYHDQGEGNRVVIALAIRVGLSISVVAFLLLSYVMGWIGPGGLR